jgi:two-component system KDP operon response regulator KdpE
VVEDDAASRKALRAILSRQGWEVLAAATLAEGRHYLESAPHVLILDLMLPDGDGTSLLRLIREENRPVKVIVTTGSSDSAKLAAVRLLKPDAIVVKPVDLDKLLLEVGRPC